ncbi:MAG: tetratricopeptide repeat protein [Thiohalomonadales bacterium]
MTALRWFLSYLLPILIITSIAAAYFYRDQLTNNWYHTLSWPVTQINTVLQQQKLQRNTIEPELVSKTVSEPDSRKSRMTEIVTNNSNESEKRSKTADSKMTENVELKKETIENQVIGTQHPIEYFSKNRVAKDSESKTELPPKTAKIVTPETLPEKPVVAEQLVKTPQAQQHYMPYPQPRMIPPVMRPVAPGFRAPNFNPVRWPAPQPPTQFKLSKKQNTLLYQARKAFWTKDIKTAKQHYLTLIKQLPDNPEVHGELGNIFYTEQKIEKAIKHYSLAAELLIKHRHYWKLPQIMNIILRFNPDKAREIKRLMFNKNNITTQTKNINKQNNKDM